MISKGVRVEVHDFVPKQQEGLKKKFPEYERDFIVAFPIANKRQLKNLEERGYLLSIMNFVKTKR